MNIKFWRKQQRAEPITRSPHEDLIAENDWDFLVRGISAEYLSVIEACVGLISRCFAMWKVTGLPARRMPPRGMLVTAIREMALKGEAILYFDNSNGELEFYPVSDWTVIGNSNYQYDLRIAYPNSTRIINGVSPDSILCFKWASDHVRWWSGKSPIATTKLTAALAQALERVIERELKVPITRIVPVPNTIDADAVGMLKQAILKGGVIYPPSPTGYNESAYNNRLWDATRIGSQIDQQATALREQVRNDLMAAYGVPERLVYGAPQREAFRFFLFSTLEPLSRCLLDEMERKLGGTLEGDWSQLSAADVQGRARAFGSLVQAGMPPKQAEVIASVITPVDYEAPPKGDNDD